MCLSEGNIAARRSFNTGPRQTTANMGYSSLKKVYRK